MAWHQWSRLDEMCCSKIILIFKVVLIDSFLNTLKIKLILLRIVALHKVLDDFWYQFKDYRINDILMPLLLALGDT